MKKQIVVPLKSSERIAHDMFLHVYDEPEIAAHARPGQFINVRVSGASAPLLRRPFSICWTDAVKGEFAVLFKVVGQGSEALARADQGDRIDVVGPLGTSFDWRGTQTALLVGGGVGIAPLHFLASEIAKARLAGEAVPRVIFAYGARNAQGLAMAQEISAIVDEMLITTEDGSVGGQGFVTGVLPMYLNNETTVFSCGPTPMMAATLRLMRANGLEHGFFSLENQMGCAMGVCMGCVVPTRQGYMRVCCDGPVLAAEILDFDLMTSFSAP